MPVVFRQFFLYFGFLDGKYPRLEATTSCRIFGQRGNAGTKYESEKVIRILEKNRVGLCLRERNGTRHFGDSSHVVAVIQRHRREEAVRLDCHRCKKKNAIGPSRAGKQHHSVEEALGALLG